MDVYRKAYKYLETITPQKEDCGMLCDKTCCKGDEYMGMLLYPGEEEIFENLDGDWFSLKKSNVVLNNGFTLKLLTCNEDCPREMRPLACRIYPLQPYLEKDNTLVLKLDLNSLKSCPLSFEAERYPLEDDFVDAVYDAFDTIIDVDNVLEIIEILSNDRDSVLRFLTKDND